MSGSGWHGHYNGSPYGDDQYNNQYNNSGYNNSSQYGDDGYDHRRYTGSQVDPNDTRYANTNLAHYPDTLSISGSVAGSEYGEPPHPYTQYHQEQPHYSPHHQSPISAQPYYPGSDSASHYTPSSVSDPNGYQNWWHQSRNVSSRHEGTSITDPHFPEQEYVMTGPKCPFHWSNCHFRSEIFQDWLDHLDTHVPINTGGRERRNLNGLPRFFTCGFRPCQEVLSSDDRQTMWDKAMGHVFNHLLSRTWKREDWNVDPNWMSYFQSIGLVSEVDARGHLKYPPSHGPMKIPAQGWRTIKLLSKVAIRAGAGAGTARRIGGAEGPMPPPELPRQGPDQATYMGSSNGPTPHHPGYDNEPPPIYYHQQYGFQHQPSYPPNQPPPQGYGQYDPSIQGGFHQPSYAPGPGGYPPYGPNGYAQ